MACHFLETLRSEAAGLERMFGDRELAEIVRMEAA